MLTEFDHVAAEPFDEAALADARSPRDADAVRAAGVGQDQGQKFVGLIAVIGS